MPTDPVAPVPIQVNVVTQNIAGQVGASVVPANEVHIGIGASKVPSVQLTNSTGATIRVWFPNGGKLFSAATLPDGTQVKDFSSPIPVPAGTLTLYTLDSPTQGEYHYHVYCDAVQDCAQGNSEPRVGCP